MLPRIDTVVTNKRKKATFSFFYTRFLVRAFLQTFYTRAMDINKKRSAGFFSYSKHLKRETFTPIVQAERGREREEKTRNKKAIDYYDIFCAVLKNYNYGNKLRSRTTFSHNSSISSGNQFFFSFYHVIHFRTDIGEEEKVYRLIFQKLPKFYLSTFIQIESQFLCIIRNFCGLLL